MTRLAFAFAIGLSLPLAAEAGTFEITGQNGGTMNGAWTCLPVNGVWTCSSQSIVTDPQGQTGTRTRSTTLAQGVVTSTIEGTRIGGRSFGRTSSWQR